MLRTSPLSDHELITCRHWLDRQATGGRVTPASAIDSPGTRAALRATWPRAHYLPPPHTDEEWFDAVHLTQAWLNSGELLEGEGHALLGACVASNEGARARIDVLSSGERGLRIGRLRLATSGKDDDIDLIAWWTHVAARSGVRVQGMHLMLIEQDFVYPGHGCMAGVFREVDVSPVLGTRDVPAWLVGMRQTERGTQPGLPDKLNCLRPSDMAAPCPHLSHCGLSQRMRDGLAPDALEDMGREMADVLRAMGYRELLAVPEAMLPDARRRRAWRAIMAGRPIIEPEVHIQRFEPPHVTPAEVYAHSMQDRLSAPEVKQLREALIQHARQEVAALRAILRLLVHADDAQ